MLKTWEKSQELEEGGPGEEDENATHAARVAMTMSTSKKGGREGGLIKNGVRQESDDAK